MRDKGKRGMEIAIVLWPRLIPVSDGGWEDIYWNIDAYLEKKNIQVKYDIRILETRNLYHEIYERSYPGIPWRKCVCGKEDAYIFTSENGQLLWGMMVSINDLALLETGRTLRTINPTSIGFLFPLDNVVGEIKAIPKSILVDTKERRELAGGGLKHSPPPFST